MLQVRENDISLRKWSGTGGAAQLCTLKGTLRMQLLSIQNNAQNTFNRLN